MSPNHLRCKKCGYEADVLEDDLMNFNECPICGTRGSIIIDNEKTKPLTEIEMEIEQMKILLKNPGQDWIWQEIEKYNDIIKRLKYRQIFFLAGGEIYLTQWENIFLCLLKKGN